MIYYVLYITRIFSEAIPYLSAIIGFVIISLFFLRFTTDKINFDLRNYFINFMVIYSGVTFIGVIVATAKFGKIIFLPSLYDAIKPLSVILMFFIIGSDEIFKKTTINRLLNVIVIIYAIISLYSLYNVLTNQVYRASWPTSHPNSLGIILVVLCAYSIINYNCSRHKNLNILGIIILLSGVYATKSLSAIFMFFMILTIYYYYKYSIRNTVFMVLILLASLFLSELFISDRLESLNYNYRHYLDLWNLNYTKFGSSFGWRIVNWRYLYNEFLKSPIFGLGNVSWMIVNPLRNTGGPLGGFNPHSEFFGLLVQFGLLGTTLFIVAAIIAIVNCVKEIKRKDFAPFEAIFITSLLAGFLGKEMMYLQLYFILILIFYEGKRKDLMENPSPV